MRCAWRGSKVPPTTLSRQVVPFLGICVGMQMLFTKSQENEHAAGLDVIPGTVTWIPPGPKIPQMQWNRLDVIDPSEPMLHDLGDQPYVYFVHSLHGVPDDPGVIAATVEYGTTLNAAFRHGNVFAVQFHPEKSSRPGACGYSATSSRSVSDDRPLPGNRPAGGPCRSPPPG